MLVCFVKDACFSLKGITNFEVVKITSDDVKLNRTIICIHLLANEISNKKNVNWSMINSTSQGLRFKVWPCEQYL